MQIMQYNPKFETEEEEDLSSSSSFFFIQHNNFGRARVVGFVRTDPTIFLFSFKLTVGCPRVRYGIDYLMP
jgi:hypothetical protein